MESTDNTGQKLFLAQSPYMPHAMLYPRPTHLVVQALTVIALPYHFKENDLCYYQCLVSQCHFEVHVHLQAPEPAVPKLQETNYTKDKGLVYIDLNLQDYNTLPLVYAPMPMYLSHFEPKQQYVVLKSLYQMPFVPQDMLDFSLHLSALD